MRRGLVVAVIGAAVSLIGCSEPSQRSADPRIAPLRDRQTKLEAARADAVRVYGEDCETVRVLDRQLELIDQQIARYESPT